MAEVVNLPLPYLKNNTFDYNGTNQSGGAVSNINNYNRNYMTVTGTISGINACPVNEPYKIIISLIPDTANYIYKWIDEDGNTFRDNIILEWRINPIKIKKPDVWKTVKNDDGTTEKIYYTGDRTLTYNYDGSALHSTSCYKMPSIETEYSEGKKYTNVLDITGDGTVKKYKAGDYSIIFSIKHPDSCSWDDDDSADSYTVIWKIVPSKFKVPVVTSEDFVYDGNPHKPNVEYYNKNVMSYDGYMNAYTSAKEYYITFSLYDKDSCSWEDGSTDSKTVYWNINKKIVYVDKPYLEDDQREFIYDGTEHKPIITNYGDGMSATGTVSSVAASDENIPWKINISLKTTTNYLYLWNVKNEEDKSEDNQTKNIVLEWVVKKGGFKVPVISPEHLDFNGKLQKVSDVGYDTAIMKRTGSMSGTKAEEYTVTYALLDTQSAYWEVDGTTAPKEVKWYIDKITVEIPAAKNPICNIEPTYEHVRIYYGNDRADKYYVLTDSNIFELNGLVDNIMSVESESSLGTIHTVTIKLNDPDSSAWIDGSTENKTIEWEIKKKVERLAFPEFEERDLIYNGFNQRPVFKNKDSKNLDFWAKTVDGVTLNYRYGKGTVTDISYRIPLQKDVGDYTVIVGLLEWVYTSRDDHDRTKSYDIVEFQWEDGSTNPIELTWSIKKAFLTPPTISPVFFDYDGNPHSITVNGFDSRTMTIEADSVTKESAAGEYTVRFSLNNKESTAWDDGTEYGITDDIVCRWVIGTRDKIEIPTVTSTSFVYDGEKHYPNVGDYDTDIILEIGEKEINADKYKIVFRLKDGNSSSWADGTTDDKEFEWEITKKTVYCEKPYIDPATKEYQYNGNNFYPTVIGLNNAGIIAEGDIFACEAGEHIITASLKEDNNIEYRWDDDSADIITLQWKITEAVIDIPEVEPTLFFYGGYFIQKVIHNKTEYTVVHHAWRHPLVKGYNPYTMNADGITESYVSKEDIDGIHYTTTPGTWYGESQWDINKYNIEFTLKHPDSCSWSDGTKGKIVYEWSIVREIKLLSKPYIENKIFNYDGISKTPDVINGDIPGVILSGDTEKTSAGDYTITASVKKILEPTDIYDYRWQDNTTVDIPLDWHILNDEINIPSVSSSSFAYDGTPHFPVISGFNENIMKMTGKEETAAQEYEIIFALIDPESCTWNDKTTEEKIFKWHILKSTAKSPSIYPESIMYDGVYHTVEFKNDEDTDENNHSFIVSNFDPNTMDYRGNVREIDAEKYSVVISLKDPDSCTWEDGSSADKILEWEITKKTVLLDRPYLDIYNFDYDDFTHAPKIVDQKGESLSTAGMVISGDTSAVNADKYLITVTPAQDNNITYLWGDETDTPVNLEWCIEKIKIKVPSVTGLEFTYDGKEHSPNVVVDKSAAPHISVSGTLKATKAKDYTITFSLNNPGSCVWDNGTEDGSTDDIVREWKIKKATAKKPSVTDTLFTYDKSVHFPNISEYDENIISLSGISSAVNADKYYIEFSLIDTKSCTWEDGTIDPIVFNWEIKKQSVPKPRISNTEFIYNGGTHAPTLSYDTSLMKASGDLDGVIATKYKITVTLIDSKNYFWRDESEDEISEPLIFKWEILKKTLNKPRLEPEKFSYNGKEQSPNIVEFRREAMYAEGDTSGQEVGWYTIIIRLNENYQWADESTDDLLLKWEITKITVPLPVVSDTSFIYDKTIHSPKIEPFDTNVINCKGTLSEVNSDEYFIVFSLTDKEYCQWDNLSNEDITVQWTIHKRTIPKPLVTNTHFVYNGGKNLPTISGFDPDTMNLDGTYEEINAGNYIFNISLADTHNYQWEDETTAILYFPWDIGRLPIEVPYLEPDTFVYNAAFQSPVIKNYNENIMEILKGSIISARDVKEYRIFIHLGERKHASGGGYYYVNNYEWINGSTDDIILTWSITPKSIEYPTISNDSFIYDGQTHSPVFHGFIKKAMITSGTSNAVNVGEYKVGFILTDTKNYQWSNGADDSKQYPWNIIPAKLDKKIDIPIQNPVLIYNGAYQTPTWSNYNRNKLTIGGVITGKNADEYIAEFTPTNNYVWEDDTRDPVEISWLIEKLGIENPIQKNKLFYTGEEQSPEWNVNYSLVNISFSGEITGINAREYEVICVCDNNCYFLSTGTDTCRAFWEINKKVLSAPYVKQKYYYTGEIIVPGFKDYDPGILAISGDINGIDVGDYIALFEIKDKNNYTWAEDVVLDKKNGGKVKIGWEILSSLKIAKIPYQSNYLIYNGNRQSPTWNNYNTNAMLLAGGTPFKVSAGTYYVTFTLKNGFIWSDGTNENKIVPWNIYKKSLPYPYIAGSESDGSGMYYYELEGKRYPIWRNYDPGLMTMSGDTFDIDNSWHTTYFDLKDTDNYEWEDERIDTYTVRWKLTSPYAPEITGGIGSKRVHIPRQKNAPVEDGTTKYPEWDFYDSTAIVNIGGEWEGVESREYYVILELRKGYIWEDGTEKVKAVPWKIYDKGEMLPDGTPLIPVHIPKQINPPYYDGTVKQPEWDEWNEFGIDYKYGELYGVNAGDYYIKISLKTGYIWEDGTTEDRIVVWVINSRKKDPDIAPPENPRKPDPEKEGAEDENCCCCAPCCPDTGLFDKLNDYDFDDGFVCDCSEKTDL